MSTYFSYHYQGLDTKEKFPRKQELLGLGSSRKVPPGRACIPPCIIALSLSRSHFKFVYKLKKMACPFVANLTDSPSNQMTILISFHKLCGSWTAGPCPPGTKRETAPRVGTLESPRGASAVQEADLESSGNMEKERRHVRSRQSSVALRSAGSKNANELVGRSPGGCPPATQKHSGIVPLG